jgi:hypothetical protein
VAGGLSFKPLPGGDSGVASSLSPSCSAAVSAAVAAAAALPPSSSPSRDLDLDLDSDLDVDLDLDIDLDLGAALACPPLRSAQLRGSAGFPPLGGLGSASAFCPLMGSCNFLPWA